MDLCKFKLSLNSAVLISIGSWICSSFFTVNKKDACSSLFISAVIIMSQTKLLLVICAYNNYKICVTQKRWNAEIMYSTFSICYGLRVNDIFPLCCQAECSLPFLVIHSWKKKIINTDHDRTVHSSCPPHLLCCIGFLRILMLLVITSKKKEEMCFMIL